MRWLGVARKRVRTHLAALAAVWATLLISLLVLGSLQLFALVIGDASARGVLESADPAARTIAVNASIKAGTLPARRAEVTAAIAGIPGARLYEADTAVARGIEGRGPQDRAVLADLPALTSLARLDVGAWPTPPAAGRPVEAVVPTATAHAAGWQVGQELRLPSLIDASAAPVQVRISGTFTPRDRSDPTWLDAPLALAGVGKGDFTAYGPLVLAPGAFDGDLGAGASGAWRVTIPWQQMSTGDVRRFQAALGPALEKLRANSHLRVATGLDRLLATSDLTANRVRIALLTPTVLLMLLGGTALALASVQLSTLRTSETALLRSRGASARQILALAGLEAGIIVGSSLLATLLLAPALVQPLAGATGLLATGTRVRDGLTTPSVWVTMAVSAALGALIMVATAIRGGRLRTEGAQSARMQRLARFAGSGLDLALIALGVLGVLQLRRYDAAAAKLDPLTIAAPALFISGLAVVALRVIPYAARLASRIGSRSAGLGLAWGAWQVARRIAGQGVAILLLLLAMAMGTLALGQQRTLSAALSDQSDFAAGAPVVVELGPAARLASPSTRTAELAGGADRSMAVYRTTSYLPGSTAATSVLAVDTRAPGVPLPMRPDIARGRSWADLFAAVRTDPLGIPVPAGAARFDVSMRVSSFSAFGADRGALVAVLARPDGSRVDAELGMIGLGRVRADLDLGPLDLPTGTHLLGMTISPDVPWPLGNDALSQAQVNDVVFAFDGTAVAHGDKPQLSWGSGVLILGPRLRSAPIPVVMTDAAAAHAKLKIGSTGTLPLLLGARPVKLMGTVAALPTGSPDPTLGVLADLAAVNDALFFPPSAGVDPNPAALDPQSYWLAPSDPAQAAAQLTGEKGLVSAVTTREEILAERRAGAVNAGMRWAMRLVTAAAAVLALLGFAATTAALGATRAHDCAVLAALGMPPKGIRRVLVLERLTVVVVTVVTGLALGLAGSGLIVPLLVGADGHPQIPPIRLVLDLPAVLLFATAMITALSVVAALVVSRIVRDISAQLREGER
ncbi:ABC transporter permease [Nostocoides vanveenii]|uniref:ABC transporter permease n=1 Tax=Nostocoides vanveenii TaxID=330835 RepID=A0ABN2JYZ0_9MICO